MINLRAGIWWFKEDILEIPGRTIAFCFFSLLFVFPTITSNDYLLGIIIHSLLFALLAASWDFLYGFTGQLNLGPALFWGASAYTASLLSVHAKLCIWLTIPSGALAAATLGLITCLPALRLKGLFLGLVTLSLPLILTGFILAFPAVTGGDIGIFGVAPMSTNITYSYYVILVIVLIVLLCLWKLTDLKSKFVRTGIILRAIREDEIAARRAGINTTFYKMVAFAISGLASGIAGSCYAHTMRVVGTSTLALSFSFSVIVWSIFGGTGTIYGPVAGVFILYPLVEILSFSPLGEEFRVVIQCLVLMVVLLFMPQGIATWTRDQIEQDCPRCKLVNYRRRKYCRACNAYLHRDQGKTNEVNSNEIGSTNDA